MAFLCILVKNTNRFNAQDVINDRLVASGIHGYTQTYKESGVKPVINLKLNSLKAGDGTINNPYVVE